MHHVISCPSPTATLTISMETVKVIYMLDEDDTSYSNTVPNRAHHIHTIHSRQELICDKCPSPSLPCSGPNGPTLADFEAVFGRKGHFKYFFQSTEEGSSGKVEVTDNAAPLPTRVLPFLLPYHYHYHYRLHSLVVVNCVQTLVCIFHIQKKSI